MAMAAPIPFPSISPTEALLERIRASVIGDDAVLAGPFGPRRLVYADYAASGRRALSFAVFDYLVEAVDFLAEHAWKLLPLHAFDPCSGLWRHRRGPRTRPAALEGLRFSEGTPRTTAPESVLPG
jgi:hypothetical protein